jgi:predicted component of type VI protein secretion system
MTNKTIREQLCKQIDDLPDDVVEQVADFALFLMKRRQTAQRYTYWKESEWQEFSLEQLLREDDEVEYSLEDAQEIYHP